MMKENKMSGSGVNNYVNKKPTQAEKAICDRMKELNFID